MDIAGQTEPVMLQNASGRPAISQLRQLKQEAYEFNIIEAINELEKYASPSSKFICHSNSNKQLPSLTSPHEGHSREEAQSERHTIQSKQPTVEGGNENNESFTVSIVDRLHIADMSMKSYAGKGSLPGLNPQECMQFYKQELLWVLASLKQMRNCLKNVLAELTDGTRLLMDGLRQQLGLCWKAKAEDESQRSRSQQNLVNRLAQQILDLEKQLRIKDATIQQLRSENSQLNEKVFDLSQKISQWDLQIEDKVKKLLSERQGPLKIQTRQLTQQMDGIHLPLLDLGNGLRNINESYELQSQRKDEKPSLSASNPTRGKPGSLNTISNEHKTKEGMLQTFRKVPSPEYPGSQQILPKHHKINLEDYVESVGAESQKYEPISPSYKNTVLLLPTPSYTPKSNASKLRSWGSSPEYVATLQQQNHKLGSPKASSNKTMISAQSGLSRMAQLKIKDKSFVQADRSKDNLKIHNIGARIDQLRSEIKKELKSVK